MRFGMLCCHLSGKARWENLAPKAIGSMSSSVSKSTYFFHGLLEPFWSSSLRILLHRLTNLCDSKVWAFIFSLYPSATSWTPKWCFRVSKCRALLVVHASNPDPEAIGLADHDHGASESRTIWLWDELLYNFSPFFFEIKNLGRLFASASTIWTSSRPIGQDRSV